MHRGLIMLLGALWAGTAMSASFYDLTAKRLTGKTFRFADLKGKAVLVVNTASKCGYTPQLRGLQKLYEQHKDQGLVVVGFPSNDFNQEDLSDPKIGEFCKINYGVTFPMLAKGHVNGAARHPLYQFLVQNAEPAGENVSWNFEKFLVSRDGKVVGRFSSSVTPRNQKLTKAISKALQPAS